MTRAQLEHAIRAAGAIDDDPDIVAVGSQANLGQFPSAPPALLVSREADVYPRSHPERWNLIDGTIGEGSPFDDEFGYHAHGVGQETSTLPRGWKDRLILVHNENTRGVRGGCLEVHDLAIAKHLARRGKDLIFTAELARHGITDPVVLRERLAATEITEAARQLILARIAREARGAAQR